MISGTTLVPHSRRAFHGNPVPLYLGDAPVDHTLEVTKLQLAASDRAQAVDYLISQQQSDRAARVQQMSLDAAQKSADQAQQGQLTLIAAGVQSQRALAQKLTTVAVVGVSLLALIKIVGLFKTPKDAAA